MTLKRTVVARTLARWRAYPAVKSHNPTPPFMRSSRSIALLALRPRAMRIRGRRAVLLLAALVACEGDRAVRELSPSAAEARRLSARGLTGQLVLANNARPLSAAQARSDSADSPIVLAQVELAVVAGDSVTIQAAGDADIFGLATSSERLFVTVDGATTSYPLNALRAGITIARATASETMSIAYRLSRDVQQPVSGAFQVVQRSSAQVSSAKTPWVSPARSTFASSLASSCSGSGCTLECSLDAPTGDCGGSVWNISPYVTGSPFCCFQSSPGSGQQYPITLTFSDPISGIRITIEDPTYAGNTMTAYGPDGAVVGNVGFAFTGVPGNNVPDTQEILGRISRVVLTNDPNDYIAYHGTITIAPDSVTVACTQPVTRGNPITCTATPLDPSASIQVTQWQFTAPGLANPITEASTNASWPGGKAVLSGTVTVTASINGGTSAPHSKKITVQPRPWNTAADTVQWSIDTLPQATDALPDKPTALGQLGVTAPYAGISLPVNGYEQVTAGPNKGLWFFTKVPGEGKPTTAANKIALKDSSDFWLKQPKSGGGINVCKRVDVAPFLPKVIDHEGFPNGYAPPPQSHTGSLRAELNRRIPKATEAIWSSVGQFDLETKATSAAQADVDAAIRWSRDQQDGGSVPPVTYCTFKYF